MSNLQAPGRLSGNGDGGPALTMPQGHSSHICSAQPSIAEQTNSCPYAEKAVPNASATRIILMFLRDFVEQQTLYAQSSQGCFCPMIKCYQSFADPMSLIQHVLSCPELPGGEFQCWKCLNWHELPADEKEWSECAGWKPDLHQGAGFPQKRSLSTKMKETFLRRRSSARKVTIGSPIKPDMDGEFPLDTRLHPEVTGVLNNIAYCRTLGQAMDVEHPPRDMAGFHDAEKAAKPTSPSSVDVEMLWPDMTPDSMCGLSATTPTTPFDHVQSPSQHAAPLATALTSAQVHPSLAERTIIRSPDQLGSPQGGFNNWAQVHQHSFDCYSHPSSPPLTMNNSLLVGDLPVPPQLSTPVSLAAPVTMADKPPVWPGPRAGGDLARLSPVSWRGTDASSEKSIRDSVTLHMPTNNYSFVVCPPIQAPTPRAITTGIPMPNALAITPNMSTANSSQETLHVSPANNLYAAAQTAQPQDVQGMILDHDESRAASPTPSEEEHGHDDMSDDLVCDQCQWRPRGVKENLRGYLRKHKNVHKGLRLPCDYPNCKKTFSRLDNLKKHRREKHGLDAMPVDSHTAHISHAAHVAHAAHAAHGAHAVHPPHPPRGPRDSSEHNRGVFGDHSVLWPGLHL